jgi:hypothetical protein
VGAVDDMLGHSMARCGVAHVGRSIRRKGKGGSRLHGPGGLAARPHGKNWAGQLGCAEVRKPRGLGHMEGFDTRG